MNNIIRKAYDLFVMFVTSIIIVLGMLIVVASEGIESFICKVGEKAFVLIFGIVLVIIIVLIILF